MHPYPLTKPIPNDRPDSSLYLLTNSNNSIISQYSSFLLNADIELAPGTAIVYRNKLKKFIDFCAASRIERITEVTTDTARAFIASMQQAGLCAISVFDFYKFARRFFSWMALEGRLDSNPLARVKPRHPPEVIIRTFSPEHIRKILLLCDHSGSEFASRRNRAMVLVLLDTGFRLSELAAIRVHQIDIRAGIISVMGKRVPERGSWASAWRL
jgi:site-specific recombinase XerD